jgi:hypothetical protein
MRRNAAILSAVTLALAGAPIAHGAPRGGYEASLTAPMPPRQEIVDGVLWKCAGERCAAPAGGSRPVLVCQRIARAFGAVARFVSPAGVLSSEDLSRCNGAS